MRKLLLGTAAFAVIAGPAIGADLAVRPVLKPPVPIASWTGFYVGLNSGGSIGASSSTDSAVFTTPTFFGSTSGGSTPLFNDSFRHVPTGWIVGGQLGYNYQVSSFVLGIEADWQWSGQKDTVNTGCSTGSTASFFFLGGSMFGQCLADEQKLTNFGTARARAGVLANDSLWYVTGGAAWATVKENLAFGTNCNPCAATAQPGILLPAAASISHSKAGWTLGGGVETRLGGGFSAKLEYLYVDLGTITDGFGLTFNPLFLAFPPAAAAASSAGVATSSHVTDHIVRIGLNYQIF
jgi:outer membrane immunogenic protein